jgi:methionine sulfoxide reductase heme-binding subunit
MALPPRTIARLVGRGAPMLGYQALFLAIVSAAHPAFVQKLFGRPFLRLHHWLATIGLCLLTVHGLAIAVDFATAQVLAPRFDSARAFLQWGGSVSLYLLLALTAASFLKRGFRGRWRSLHLLSYLAFYLATLHGLLLGIDFQRPLTRAVILLMAMIAGATPLWRRTLGRRRPKGPRIPA